MIDIDANKVTKVLEQYIRELMKVNNHNCVILGLSGGIDSAVLATLAVRAVGAERVKAYHLKDRDSEKDSEIKARILADWLGIELEIQDISPAMHKKGVYSPLIMRLTPLTHFFNRLFQQAYYLLFREVPHTSTLKADCDELGHNPFKRLVFNLTIRHIGNSFNARHIYRREVIEKAAAEQNGLVLGAANRSESMAGWFVKDGIDDLPIQPMLGLYKTQVWQLADHLGLPAEIRHQEPSPDMMKGITDEFAIGIRYDRLDEILDYLERGEKKSEILAHGVSRKELKLVQDNRRFSAWMRESPHVPPPVDGGVSSPFRINASVKA